MNKAEDRTQPLGVNGRFLLLIFLCIYIFMLVFCEKWNIIMLEVTNKLSPDPDDSQNEVLL